MSAKKPKAPKVPELPPPPAITDARVQEAEQSDRLARRKGAMAAVFAGRSNRTVRPQQSPAEAARAAARDRARQGNSASGSQANIDAALAAERLRQAGMTAIDVNGIRTYIPQRAYP